MNIFCVGRFFFVKIAVVVLMCAAALISCANNEPTTDEEPLTAVKSEGIGVVIIEGTVLRLDPTIYSAVVTNIKRGEKLKLLGKSSKKMWIGGKNLYWYRVKYSKGYTGWIYGNNLKIFRGDDEQEQVEKYLTKFWKEEHKKFSTSIMGRWKSIRTDSRNPEQFVEIYDEKKYKAFTIDGETEANVHEGEYRVNYGGNELIFQNGAYFGNRLVFMVRENVLYLVKEETDNTVRFRRVARFK